MRRAAGWIGAGLAAALFAPALAGSATLVGNDLGLFSVPALSFAAEAWRAGRVPGWNPWIGLGQPYRADLSFMAFHPLNALALVASPVTALNLGLALGVAVGFAGAWRLGRGLGLSTAGAAAGAAAFALGGVQVSHLLVQPYHAATALLPWALLASRRALAPGAHAGDVALAAVPFALDLLGSAPESAAAAGLSALALALSDGVGPARAAVRLLAVGALGLALAGVAVVPFALAAGETSRAGGLPWALTSTWSFHPLELLGLVAPGVADEQLLLRLTGHAEPGRAWYSSCYVGAGGVVLAALALPAAWRSRRWRPLLLLALAGLLYALGRFGPLYPLLWEAVPLVRALRYPAKALVPFALVLALLVGLGVDRARRGPAARTAAWTLCGVGALLLAVALAAWGPAPGIARGLAHGGVAALAAAGVARRAAGGGTRGPAAGALLAALVTADVSLAAARALVFAPRAVYEQRPALVDDVLRVERAEGAPARVASLGSAWGKAIDAPGLGPAALAQLAQREALFPNTGAPLRVRSAVGFSSLVSRRVGLLGRALAARDVAAVDHARLLGARLAVAAADDPEDVPLLAPVARAGPWLLGHVAGAPAWCALRRDLVRVATLDEALARVAAPGFDPRAACVVEDPAGAASAVASTAAPGGARLVRHEAERLEVEVEAPAAALLVVREGWDPGWSATVDGAPAPVLAVDALFRGVPVPAGARRVVLRFEAAGAGAGGAVSAVVAVAAAAAGLAALRRARQP